ncbi:ABC transporter ATP-binding protein [Pantoea piersonii]|uniref:ABC transporter ATP-binding protein n=1 Tax=Pantoea piersonii TaxID=2364647 RepID=UPI0028AFA84B|nr:ABC transporter ATP-binding protein [Pantoea piersonii]
MYSIKVENVSKVYKQYTKKADRLIEWVLPGKVKRHREKRVLHNISFEIKQGEAVGIIGVNGAGKSTLLKIITGTTAASSGQIKTNGRIAALLELGMGFHPDFTGRQNAIMAGQLLGIGEDEMESVIQDVENFAGVGEYFDAPVRTYSSGMQARVAFSVATAVKADILIVDEALSVGDLAFQAKCMQRMNRMLQDNVTILFVSHALFQVRQFCNRAVYIADGEVKAFGPAADVCDLYQNSLVENKISLSEQKKTGLIINANSDPEITINPELRANSLQENTGNLDLEFLDFTFKNAEGEKIATAYAKDRIKIDAIIRCNRDVPAGACVGMLIGDKNGFPVLSMNANYYNARLPELKAGEHVILSWDFIIPFYMGEYRIDIGIKPEPYSQEFYDRVFCVKVFTVNTPVELLKENFGGMLHVPADITIIKK